MRKSVIALALAAVVLVQGLAAAATPEKDLPQEIAGHISMRSLRGLVANIDRYVAAASKGSQNEIPSGFLSMMSMIYLPVPMDDWESDGPVSLVILDAETTKDMPYVVFFQAPDYDRLVATLSESGWSVGDAFVPEEHKKAHPVVVPGGDRKILVDMGDGRIALADSFEDLQTVKDSDWSPEHLGEADVRANVAMKNKDNPLTKFVHDMIAEKKDRIISNVDKMGLKPSFSQGIVQVLEKYGPEAAAEVDKIRFLLLEIRFADGVASVDIGAKFEPKSLGDLIAAGVDKSDALDLSLAGRIPAGAASVSVSHPATRVLPNAAVANCFRAIAETAIPGMGDKVEAVVKAFYSSKPGQAASGNFLDNGRHYTISYMQSENPRASLAAIVMGIDAMNEAWASVIEDRDYGIAFVPDQDSSPEKGVHFATKFANPEKFQEFLDKARDVDPDFSVAIDPYSNMNIHMVSDDHGVIMGVGDIDKDEFADAVDNLREADGKGIFQTPAAERLMSRLEFGKASIGVLDPMGLFSYYANAASHAHDGSYGQPESNPFRIAMEKMTLTRDDPTSLVAFSLGADGNWLLNRFLVPAAAMNEVAKLYDEFNMLRKQAAEDLNLPDDVEVPDDYEDDFEDEPEEDEESAA